MSEDLYMDAQLLFGTDETIDEVFKQHFSDAFEAYARAVYQNSANHGFHESPLNDGEKIALMHSELSEALEAIRKPGKSEHIPGYSALSEELADTIIRIMDYAVAKGMIREVADAITAKHNFNCSRPYEHGGKAF